MSPLPQRPEDASFPEPDPEPDPAQRPGPAFEDEFRAGAKNGPEPGPDPTERDFGPEPNHESCHGFGSASCNGGPIPGVPCGGDGCFLKPVASLIQTMFLQLSQNHPGSLRHATASGIEMMKAMREFLDEGIAIAERARAAQTGQRFHKIQVD